MFDEYNDKDSGGGDVTEVRLAGNLNDLINKEIKAELAMSHGRPMLESELHANVFRTISDFDFSEEEIEKMKVATVQSTIRAKVGAAKRSGTSIIVRLAQDKPVTEAAMNSAAVLCPADGLVVPIRWATPVVVHEANLCRISRIKSRRREEDVATAAYESVSQRSFDFLSDLCTRD